MLIAIPAFRLSCNVGIDRGRAWSVVDELMLWATAVRPRSIAQLATESNLPHQLVVASIARMMRFRLVELMVRNNNATLQASAYGREIIEGGRPLPFFPKRELRRVSFVIERATGSFFPSAQVRLRSEYALQQETDQDVRILVVEGGGPSMSNEANLARLSRIAARGWEEQVALVDGRTASLRQEYMVIRVVDGVPRNMPEEATATLRAIIEDVAARPAGPTQIAIGYGGPAAEAPPALATHACHLDLADLVIGGSTQLECLRSMLATAHARAIIHSTFLDHYRFKELLPEIKAACMRGVAFDLLWGAETLDEEETRNSAAAVEIAKTIRNDRDLARKFRVHMRSTRSHAKLLLVDTADGDWVAAVGSCNWLSSPFRSTEVTVVLRDPRRRRRRRGHASAARGPTGIVGRHCQRDGTSDSRPAPDAVTARDGRNLARRRKSARLDHEGGQRSRAEPALRREQQAGVDR